MDKAEINIFLILATCMIITFIAGILYFIFHYRQRRVLHERNIRDLHSNYTREILTSRIEMKEETLKSVASELHDNVGHMITIGLMHLNLMPQLVNEEDETKLQEARLQLNNAIDGLRDISKTMNADTLLQNGLAGAVEQQLKRLRKSSFYQVAFTTEGAGTILKDEQHTLIIFRIIQESITNIIRHSKARQIKIHFNNHDEKLVITIFDNGVGFNVTEILQEKHKGNGLSNIFNRAKLIGAAMNIESSSKGTLSTLTYPLI